MVKRQIYLKDWPFLWLYKANIAQTTSKKTPQQGYMENTELTLSIVLNINRKSHAEVHLRFSLGLLKWEPDICIAYSLKLQVIIAPL